MDWPNKHLESNKMLRENDFRLNIVESDDCLAKLIEMHINTDTHNGYLTNKKNK